MLKKEYIMRIKTGIVQSDFAFKRTCFIKYKCSKCDAEDIFVYNIVSKQTGFYHDLGGEIAEQNVKSRVALQASEEINKFDAELFKSININRDYKQVTQKIICPKCGEKQIWSGIPCKWKNVSLFKLWLVGLIVCTLTTVLTFIFAIGNADAEILPFMMAFYTGVLSVFPLLRKCKIKKALKRIKASDFVPPIYYNESNILELREEISKKEKQ